MPIPAIVAGAAGRSVFRMLGVYIVTGLGYAAGAFFRKALVALGLTFVTYVGVESFISEVEDVISSGLGGLPAVVVQALSAMGAFDALSLIFAAVSGRVAVAGASVVFKRGYSQ